MMFLCPAILLLDLYKAYLHISRHSWVCMMFLCSAILLLDLYKGHLHMSRHSWVCMTFLCPAILLLELYEAHLHMSRHFTPGGTRGRGGGKKLTNLRERTILMAPYGSR